MAITERHRGQNLTAEDNFLSLNLTTLALQECLFPKGLAVLVVRQALGLAPNQPHLGWLRAGCEIFTKKHVCT